MLAHQAGLAAIDEPLTVELLKDLDALAAVLARQTTAWEPGTRHGYHVYSLGFYENELIRRVDPRHRSLGRFFQDEDSKTRAGRPARSRAGVSFSSVLCLAL